MTDAFQVPVTETNVFPFFLLSFTARSNEACPLPNNLPPLYFHSVHGDSIRISRDGAVARRYDSFCRAISFSARPVRINERICVKILDTSINWNGGLRVGFSCVDPATLEGSLPKFVCPDLTNRPGFWARAIPVDYCKKNNVIFYYVNSSGDVIYGINGEEKGMLLNNVNVRGLMWTVMDIYGNCTAVEFLDPRVYLYNQYPSTANFQRQSHSRRSMMVQEHEMESIMPSMQSLNIAPESDATATPQIRYNNSNRLIPVPFHSTKGRNVRLSHDRFIASRTSSAYDQGYVFTSRPIAIGEKIIVQILKTEAMYVGTLALGLTSCNPASLNPNDLPDDSDCLLDRPEYWVVTKDIASTPQRGDEIAFCVTPNGEVTISKNCGPSVVVMHVDISLQLWAFLDVYGSTESIRVFRQQTMNPMPSQQSLAAAASVPQVNRILSAVSLPVADSIHSISSQINDNRKISHHNSMAAAPSCSTIVSAASSTILASGTIQGTSNGRVINVPPNAVAGTSEMIQIQPGGTVLVVNLPPSNSHADIQQISAQNIGSINGIASASSQVRIFFYYFVNFGFLFGG